MNSQLSGLGIALLLGLGIMNGIVMQSWGVDHASAFASNLTEVAQGEDDEAVFSSTIISMNGVVTFRRATTSYWDQATLSMNLYALDELKTGLNSFCELRFKAGHIIRLEPSSNLIIAGINKERKTFDKFKFSIGKIWVKIVKGTSRVDQFSIETPHATISVKGTLYSAMAPVGTVSAFEGIVQLAQGAQNILVNSGFESLINSTGFFQNPIPLSPESLNAFQQFSQVTSLAPQQLGALGESLTQPLIPGSSSVLPDGSASGLPSVPGSPSVMTPEGAGSSAPDALATDASALKNGDNLPKQPAIKESSTEVHELSMLTDVSDQIVNDESLLYRNPALLCELSEKRSTSLYAMGDFSDGMSQFLNKTKDGSYRYVPNSTNDPRMFNSGLASNISSRLEAGFNSLNKNSALGLYFTSRQQARFMDTYVDARQMNEASTVVGLGFPFSEQLSFGFLVKGVMGFSQSNIPSYNALNMLRNSGRNLTGFSELVNSDNQKKDNAAFFFTSHAGVSFKLNTWWISGISIENLFFSDATKLDNGVTFTTNLDKILHASTIFHFPRLLVQLDIAKPQKDSFPTFMFDTQVKLLNIPWLGQLKAGVSGHHNDQSNSLTVMTSFKVWLLQVIASYRTEKAALPNLGSLQNTPEDRFGRIGIKIDF